MNLNYKHEEMLHMFQHSETYNKIKEVVRSGRHLERKDFPSTIRANYHHLANTLVLHIYQFENSNAISHWTFSPDEAEIIEIFIKETN